jgi:hypothetical protein
LRSTTKLIDPVFDTVGTTDGTGVVVLVDGVVTAGI